MNYTSRHPNVYVARSTLKTGAKPSVINPLVSHLTDLLHLNLVWWCANFPKQKAKRLCGLRVAHSRRPERRPGQSIPEKPGRAQQQGRTCKSLICSMILFGWLVC